MLKSKRVALSVFFLLGMAVSVALPLSTVFESVKEENTIEANAAVGDYYSGITDDMTGTTLLTALQSLNANKRTSTVGYDSMWTYYPQTDKDPANTSQYIAYYSGESLTKASMNKEHVWPNSHGGGKKGSVGSPYVEADIHMPRPADSGDNSSRGNSYFVEGSVSSTSGWDPVAYSRSKSLNWPEYYRGDAARIIFYCVVADPDLVLSDNTISSTPDNTMGKISDLLKWNLAYETNTIENQRNEAAQSIQGNRNPFIDHPEYACRIWSGFNSNTQNVCNSSQTTLKLKIGNVDAGTSQSMLLTDSLTFTPYLNGATTNAVTWSSSNTSVATITNGVITPIAKGTTTITATYTEDMSVEATCSLTVSDGKVVSIDVSPTTISIAPNATTTFTATAAPENATNKSVTWSIDKPAVATINSSTGVVTGLTEGTATVTATANDGSNVTGTASLRVEVVSSTTYQLVKNVSDLVIGRKVQIAATDSTTQYAIGAQSGTYRSLQTVTIKESGTDKSFDSVEGLASLTLGESTTNTGKYTFYCDDSTNIGYLACGTGSSNNFLTNSNVDAYSSFGISIDSNTYVATIQASSGTKNIVSYNNSASRFACYGSTQQSVQLYQQAGSTDISVESVALDKQTAKTDTATAVTLTATINPSNATNQGLSWTSSVQSVATVSNTGVVTPLAEGTTIITVTTDDGGFTATCEITVVNASGDARVWAQYFLDTTAPECATLSVQESTWLNIENSYLALDALTKDFFYNNANNTSETIIYPAAQRYLMIVNKYNYDPFVTNGNGDILADNQVLIDSNTMQSKLNTDNEVITIVVISIATFVLSFAGFYFLNKNRKGKAK